MSKNKFFLSMISVLLILSTAACGSAEKEPMNGTYVVPVQTSMPQTEKTETASSGETQTEGGETPHVISTGEAPGTTKPAESPTVPPESPQSQSGSFEKEDLIFAYKGLETKPGEVFVYQDYEDAWGRAKVEKGQACIGGGFDENYYFGEHDELSVFTLGDTGEQVIYDLYIWEEGFATAKGAEIGKTTRDELRLIYGEPDASLGATDRYGLDGIMVSFTFSGGVLSEIDYNNTQ